MSNMSRGAYNGNEFELCLCKQKSEQIKRLKNAAFSSGRKYSLHQTNKCSIINSRVKVSFSEEGEGGRSSLTNMPCRQLPS